MKKQQTFTDAEYAQRMMNACPKSITVLTSGKARTRNGMTSY
jgi:hypothetical protein